MKESCDYRVTMGAWIPVSIWVGGGDQEEVGPAVWASRDTCVSGHVTARADLEIKARKAYKRLWKYSLSLCMKTPLVNFRLSPVR